MTEDKNLKSNSIAHSDYQIATNLLTFLILMRIDRFEGAQGYLTKSKAKILRALGHKISSTKVDERMASQDSELGEWKQESVSSADEPCATEKTENLQRIIDKINKGDENTTD